MDQITSIINPEQITQNITEYYLMMTSSFLGVVGLSVMLVLLAFYSYRILKLEISVSAAIGCASLGYFTLAPILLEKIPTLPEGINLSAITGIACAILGWILAWLLHKVAIFLIGAVGGFYAGMMIFSYVTSKWPGVEFFFTDAFFWIVTGVVALLAGILFIYLFKFLYIFTTAFGGMLAVSYLLGLSIFGGNLMEMPYLIPTLAVGAIFGIVAMVVQYKKAAEAL